MEITTKREEKFDLIKQSNADPFFKIWRGKLEKMSMEDLYFPQIPTLLPKSLDTIKLTHLNSTNNYLCTSLASLGIQEELIYLLLDCDSLRDDHNYKVIQTEMGERRLYQGNDNILAIETEPKKKKPLFIFSEGKDIWAMILEKFYAMKFGLYTSILNGKPYHLIYNFLDGEYKVYQLSKEKLPSIWNFLTSHFEPKPSTEDEDRVNEYMNINSHERRKIIMLNSQYSSKDQDDFRCYMIENVKEAKVYKKSAMKKNKKNKKKKKNGSGEKRGAARHLKYIKLRLIDKDEFLDQFFRENWDEDKEHYLEKKQQDKDYYWVDYEKIRKKFASISINNFKLMNLDSRYKKSMLKMTLDGDHSCVLINFKLERDEDKIVVGIHQKNYKFFENIRPDYKYSNLRIILLRLNQPEKPEILDFDEITKNILEENIKQGVFVAKFDCSMDHVDNFLKDIFLKAKLKKGSYLLAFEIFWENTYYRNINISMHTQLNELIPLKLISSGSNFDIVFYKAFMSYYMQVLQKGKLGELNSSSFKTKKILIAKDVKHKLREIGLKGSKVKLEYLEIMNGFYIVVGSASFSQEMPNIKLFINKIFQDSRYIVSPELVNLLNGEITGRSEIILSMRNPVFFVLVRTNLRSIFKRKKQGDMSLFFDRYHIEKKLHSSAKDEFDMKDKNYNQIVKNLYFEHFFFKALIDATIPCVRKSDHQILESLAEVYIKGILERKNDKDSIEKISYQFELKKENKNQLSERSDEDSLSFVEMTEETFKILIKKYGKKNVRKWSMEDYKIYEYVFHSDNFIAFFFENQEDKIFYEEIKNFKCENLEIDGHDINKEPYFVNLSPGETHLLVCRLKEGESEYKYKYTTKFKIFGFYN